MFYSLRDAAEYTKTSLGTFRHHVYKQNRISGVVIGHTLIFTQAQLDDYVANGRHTMLVPDKSQLFSVAEAAEHIGMSLAAMKQHVYTRENLYAELVGNDRVILLDELERFNSNRRSRGRPTTTD